MGVINTVVMAGSERKREFASLRLTGMTRRQVKRTALLDDHPAVALDDVLMTDHALGVAVVSIPWPLVTAIALGSLVVVALTALATTHAATRRSPMQLTAACE